MIGKVLDNRYEIVEKIGGGGMALVYKAKCRLLNRYVAVKVLRSEFTDDEKFIESFRRESQAAASLSHPNIVAIYDVGVEQENIHYIVMEYVEGETLSEVIKRESPLDEKRALDIAKQIAAALEHAHKNHIVHRDIKPHNILITKDRRIKVADFGIAKAVTNSTITNPENVIGSVHYFSPEQARGGYVDGKSDIYSLGIVLYEMVTGAVPFEADSPISIALKHINDKVEIPEAFKDKLSKGLEEIIIKATQKNQVRRYQSVHEFYEAMDQVLKTPNEYREKQLSEDRPTQVIPKIDNEAINNFLDYEEDSEKKNKKSKKDTRKERSDFEDIYQADGDEKLPFDRKLFLTKASAIVLALIMALVLSKGILLAKDLFFTKEVPVPELIGVNYTELETVFQGVDLKVLKEGEQYSNLYQAGYIMDQDPKPGEIVKEGYTVKYVLSKGSRKASVPALVNKKLEDADIMLGNVNLEKGEVKYVNDNRPVGVIISQDPLPNIRIAEGSEVNLVVSQGVEIQTILMMKLQGKTLSEAEAAIREVGLSKGELTYEYSETVEKDVVISQSVAAGQEVREGAAINLVISKGSENPEAIPDPEPEPDAEKTVTFTLLYDQAENETFDIIIVKEVDGAKETIYEASHEKINSGKEDLSIEGSGKAKIYIYYDELLIAERNIDFETGQFYD